MKDYCAMKNELMAEKVLGIFGSISASPTDAHCAGMGAPVLKNDLFAVTTV